MTAIQANDAQVAAAKSRFMHSVKKGIAQLMQQCGYSRERATAALLREMGRGDVAFENQEVSETCRFFGGGEKDVLARILHGKAWYACYMLHTSRGGQ